MRGRGHRLLVAFAALLSVGWARAVVRAKPSPHRPTALGAPTSMDVAMRLRGGLDKPRAALALNALVGGLNGLFYLSPMRNTILREFFGIVRVPAHHPAALAHPRRGLCVRAGGARVQLANDGRFHALGRPACCHRRVVPYGGGGSRV